MGRLSSLTAVTLVAVALATPCARAAIDPETAVGVWLMDENSGDTAMDSSGHGHDGALNGPTWASGKFGSGLEFDGASWVDIPDQPALGVGAQLTLMAWFFATDINDWRQIIAKNNEYLLRIDPPGEGNSMSTFIFAGGAWEPRASAGVPNTDEWVHFAATYDQSPVGDADHVKVFVNGAMTGQSTHPGDVAPAGGSVEIGRWGSGSFFVGIIDEVAIFNVALEESDIAAIANNGLEAALGSDTAVDPRNRLTTTWANLRR